MSIQHVNVSGVRVCHVHTQNRGAVLCNYTARVNRGSYIYQEMLPVATWKRIGLHAGTGGDTLTSQERAYPHFRKVSLSGMKGFADDV